MISYRKPSGFPLLLISLFGLSGAASSGRAEPVSFFAAQRLAEHLSPTLAADQAELNSAQFAVLPAGELPDPKLQAGLENFPVSGMNSGSLSGESMTMQRFGVMQEFPNKAKRAARMEVAAGKVDAALGQQRFDVQELRKNTAQAWLRRYFLERQRDLLEQLDVENRIFSESVRLQLLAGKGQSVDVLVPKQEAIVLADRRDDVRRDLKKAEAVLRRFVGAAAAEPLQGEPPDWMLDAAPARRRLQENVRHHPELGLAAIETRRAEADLHEAQAQKTLDWSVELAYQRRDSRYGNMVSVQFTFDVPLFAARRQDPRIAAQAQQVVRAQAREQDLMQQHKAEFDADIADLDALYRQLERAQGSGLTLAQQKIDIQTADYASGKADLGSVLAARREWIEQRFRILELRYQTAVKSMMLQFANEEVMP